MPLVPSLAALAFSPRLGRLHPHLVVWNGSEPRSMRPSATSTSRCQRAGCRTMPGSRGKRPIRSRKAWNDLHSLDRAQFPERSADAHPVVDTLMTLNPSEQQQVVWIWVSGPPLRVSVRAKGSAPPLQSRSAHGAQQSSRSRYRASNLDDADARLEVLDLLAGARSKDLILPCPAGWFAVRLKSG
jgi:hypothetical protein